MAEGVERKPYKILICSRCRVQLSGQDDLEPGHPQPYCFDPDKDEVPLFEDEEIEVVPLPNEGVRLVAISEERMRGFIEASGDHDRSAHGPGALENCHACTLRDLFRSLLTDTKESK